MATVRRSASDPSGDEAADSSFEEELATFGFRYLDWMAGRLKTLDMNHGKRKLLRILRDGGPLGMTALAVAFEMEPKRMTERIDVLERVGLVRRVDRPGDRRAKVVELTEAGKRTLEQTDPLFFEAGAELFAVLDPGEVAELRSFVRRLTHRLTDLRSDPGTQPRPATESA